MLPFVTHFHTRPYRIVGNFIKTCGCDKNTSSWFSLMVSATKVGKHKGNGID
jgi:hypothetical protein